MHSWLTAEVRGGTAFFQWQNWIPVPVLAAGKARHDIYFSLEDFRFFSFIVKFSYDTALPI